MEQRHKERGRRGKRAVCGKPVVSTEHGHSLQLNGSMDQSQTMLLMSTVRERPRGHKPGSSKVAARCAKPERQIDNAHLAAVVQHCDLPIITKDLNGIIQSWNKGAERLFGYTAEEMVGQSVIVLFPPDRLNEEDHILELLRQGKAAERLETVRVSKDGRAIPVLVSISPIEDAHGRVIGASKIIHDASVFSERTAKLREMVTELRHLS